MADTFINYETFGPASAPRLLVLSSSNTPLKDLIVYVVGHRQHAKASRIGRSFHVLMFDHRGTGESGKPTDEWPAPSMSVFVDDTLALLDRLGWDSASVLALSFGAAVCAEIMLRRTNAFKIENLLMVCPASDTGVGPGLGYPLVQLLSHSAEERAERTLALADVRRSSL